MTSFSKGGDTPIPVVGDPNFRHIEQNTEVITIKVRTPKGVASALVSKNVKAGDSILIFRDRSFLHGPQAPITGLVVRPSDCGIHDIVGQVIVGDDFEIVKGGSMDRLASGALCLWTWLVFMSPADLILFVAQDLKADISPPEEGVGRAVVLSVCPEGKARRLTTSVTCGPVSSFAIGRPNWSGTPW